VIPLQALLLSPCLLAAPAAPDWAALQRRGARISAIEVQQQDVFDLTNPKEDTWIGRGGDKLHWRTREGVIRRALLFKVGDRVNVRRIRETERLLRALAFLKDAHVDLEPLPDGSVRARVWARDAWTLKLSGSLQQVGGQKSSAFGLQEQNLMGTGKTLAFSYARSPIQTSGTFAYADPQLLGSDWTLNTQYSHLSNGSARALTLQRPFLSLDTPWSATVQFQSTGSTLVIYDHNSGIYSAPSQLNSVNLGAAWAAVHSETDAWRPGAALVEQKAGYGPLTTAAPPGGLPAPDLEPRRLRGPALTLSYLEDRFEVFRDMLGMDTPEDYNLGWSGSAQAGRYLPAWGSTEAAWFTQAQLNKGWSSSDRDLILAQASLSGRNGPGGWADALTDLTLTGYWKDTPHQITAVHLALDAERRPDPEDIYYLGAGQGLSGYPNYLHPGDARWQLSANQRMLTEQRWLSLVRLGFVAFADMGSIHRLDGAGWTPVYADVGAGLRMGDLKSSLGKVILITVAVPVVREPGQNRYQLVFGNVVQF
jgi:hypothetical protein